MADYQTWSLAVLNNNSTGNIHILLTQRKNIVISKYNNKAIGY